VTTPPAAAAGMVSSAVPTPFHQEINFVRQPPSSLVSPRVGGCPLVSARVIWGGVGLVSAGVILCRIGWPRGEWACRSCPLVSAVLRECSVSRRGMPFLHSGAIPSGLSEIPARCPQVSARVRPLSLHNRSPPGAQPFAWGMRPISRGLNGLAAQPGEPSRSARGMLQPGSFCVGRRTARSGKPNATVVGAQPDPSDGRPYLGAL
jgi:hypothetical protein